MEPEVPHDQVVRVVLTCMVTLVKDQQVDLFHVHEAVHEQVVKLVCDDDQDVLFGELVAPLLRVAIVIVLLLSAVVAAHAELRIHLNCRSLLLNQVLRRCDKHDLI